MKTLLFICLIGIMSIFSFIGCKDISDNEETYLTYSVYAGKAAAYIINASDSFINPEVKVIMTNVVNKIALSIPNEVNSEIIYAEMQKIATNAIASSNIDTNYCEVIEMSVNTLLTMLKTALFSIEKKYKTEFNNSEMFYQIAYTFFNTANETIQSICDRNFMIAKDSKLSYDIIQDFAIKNFDTVNKEAFEAILKDL